ncbi:MAG: autotransporter domain-containing protein, partial [Gammaproteobacteria bacterium]|nr:autotransporter domain-containing protein [Gammaproteobacteria bacterium]
VSGQTNFGVHSGSTLSEGTYSSVLSGLTASNISSGASGTHSNANACSDVDAANVTFSSNCAELDISGDGSDVTINSGVTISGVGDYDWTLNNSSGTTWDLVSTAQLDDVVNTGTNTLFDNLGTITAVAAGANGILNQGTFTVLTNKGLVTSDSAHAINNLGTITTLNNSQGASSSALTYKGKLPSNYNVILNSLTDFGKIIFSDVSGSTNFGIHSESILNEGTYSSVLSGLAASEIASGTSGTYVSGAIRSDWMLSNNSGSEWDLVVGNKDITPDTKTSVVNSVKPNIVLGVNNLTSVTEVNFANMNTYDCDLFDKHKICLSLGSRHTVINTPKTKTDSMVLVGGYQVTDTLRVGGFFHHNVSHKTPASFKLSDKTPLVGGVVVWNQKPNRLGYQLKLANAFQQKYAAVTREVVGSSEEGKGQTVIEAKSFVAELQYGYQFNDNIILRPYFAARSAVIKQDGYTETGPSSPLSFNEIKDKSTTILPGLKINTHLTSNLSLKGSFGIEQDIDHSIDKLAPTGISGLSTVSLSDDFNQTRPVVTLGFDYMLKSNHRLSFTAQYQELPYESKTETNAYLYYTIGF